jgi:hypothetical protein
MYGQPPIFWEAMRDFCAEHDRLTLAVKSLSMQVKANADDGKGHWVTIHGNHVYIEDGKVTKGPKHMIGQSFDGKGPKGNGKQPKTPDKPIKPKGDHRIAKSALRALKQHGVDIGKVAYQLYTGDKLDPQTEREMRNIVAFWNDPKNTHKVAEGAISLGKVAKKIDDW